MDWKNQQKNHRKHEEEFKERYAH